MVRRARHIRPPPKHDPGAGYGNAEILEPGERCPIADTAAGRGSALRERPRRRPAAGAARRDRPSRRPTPAPGTRARSPDSRARRRLHARRREYRRARRPGNADPRRSRHPPVGARQPSADADRRSAAPDRPPEGRAGASGEPSTGCGPIPGRPACGYYGEAASRLDHIPTGATAATGRSIQRDSGGLNFNRNTPWPSRQAVRKGEATSEESRLQSLQFVGSPHEGDEMVDQLKPGKSIKDTCVFDL